MYSVLAVVLALICLTKSQYSCDNPCYGNMCCSIPDDNLYILTSFCDQQTACGVPCSALTYFSADSQRFGCGQNLTICLPGSSTCVGVQVIDAGPNIRVEQNANSPVIDASSQVCQDLFSQSSCGWSDGEQVSAIMANPPKMGLFTATPEEMARMILEHRSRVAKKPRLPKN